MNRAASLHLAKHSCQFGSDCERADGYERRAQVPHFALLPSYLISGKATEEDFRTAQYCEAATTTAVSGNLFLFLKLYFVHAFYSSSLQTSRVCPFSAIDPPK